MILKFFLNFGRFEPCDSYKLYSYKKESVYQVYLFEVCVLKYGKNEVVCIPSRYIVATLKLLIKFQNSQYSCIRLYRVFI